MEPIMEPVYEQTAGTVADQEYGPRKLSFFILIMKTFAGIGGGIGGAAIFLLIFLGASSILQPAVGAVSDAGEVSPLFMVVILAMMLATSMVSSLLSILFLSYTERDRYTRVSTTMVQVFILNLVIFGFIVPVYLATATTNIELTVYAAGLQLLLGALGSALILELIHDYKYALLGVYNTILAVLAAAAVLILIYTITGNATLVAIASLPIIWGSIGFFHATITMVYYWIFENWNTDFLANYASFGADYGIPDQSEEEEEEKRPDVDGADFLKED